ncbi:MAG: DUF5421 family protein [Verrucomicrobia bacterium]|nr:DUF5421 family protein [Verrucomicrobiota bacterium]MBS0645644.1 DUF5421 family protein [Verrucomicrobiota bacterium]
MSSIPPNFQSNPSPSPSSDNNQPSPPANNSGNKEFTLSKKTQQQQAQPQKLQQLQKKPVEKKLAEKKKDAPTAQQNLDAQQELKQAQTSDQDKAQIEKMDSTQKVADVKVLHSIILKNVDSIRVGKDVVQVDLKTNADVPKVFQGSQLTLSKTDAGLVIKIDGVSNVSEAQKLLTSNPEAMQVLANQLAAKGFGQAQFQVGNVTVALPSPIKATVEVASSGQQSFEREGGGQQGGGGGQQQQDEQKRHR